MSKKNRKGVVYSTNKDFDYDSYDEEEAETLEPKLQKLKVSIDRKLRRGKEVTLIEGFVGNSEDLKTLAKLLKTACGVGGTAKNGVVEIQGNQKEKVKNKLLEEGYQVK